MSTYNDFLLATYSSIINLIMLLNQSIHYILFCHLSFIFVFCSMLQIGNYYFLVVASCGDLTSMWKHEGLFQQARFQTCPKDDSEEMTITVLLIFVR